MIFTDSPQDAERYRVGLSEAFQDKIFKIFDTEKNFSPEKTMLVMSNFSIIVVANSTFSFWSAILGSSKKEVIYPRPWFSQPKVLSPQIPSNWKHCDSSSLHA
jgi:hypothetical protein